MQPRFARAHGRFRLGPNLSLDAAAADRSRDFAVLKEKHFRTTLLRSRAACVRDGSDDDTLATVVGFIDQCDRDRVVEWSTWNFVLCRSCLFCW